MVRIGILGYGNIGKGTEIAVSQADDMDENSGYCVEYITDGKMNKEKVIKSNDKNTIDNYIEFVDNTNDIIAIKNKINIYNKKKQIKK